jgi:FMN phosphatase YigB (HAD superfamily)
VILEPITTVLLDLDDTLLTNVSDSFMEAYFAALVAKLRHLVSPHVLLRALDLGIQRMHDNDGLGPTNDQVFYEEFYGHLGVSAEIAQPLIDEFYRTDFEKLAAFCQPDPNARRLVSWLFHQGYKVAIATQPVFPASAILARLRWAGVGAELFDYDLVTTFEVMRACKPSRAYYEAVLEQLGSQPHQALMVGDSIDTDLPARQYGIRTYWVTRDDATNFSDPECDAQGSLGDLINLFETGAIHALCQ